MKAAIYVRTSKIDQHPENQAIELQEYAERMNFAYDIYTEQESTRKTRPIKQDVLTKLRNREYDILLIWKIDRWGRSLQELIMDLQELTNKGIKIISLKENIDYTTASGKLFANMLSVFADYERGLISERIKLGIARVKLEGKKIGRPLGSKDKKRRRRSGYNLRWNKH